MALAIPKDSTVLVTGINGYIGSHVADQLLLAGYKVRGTARSVSKADALKALWDKQYGAGRVEIVAVPDMAVEGAFNDAIKGVSGVAHVASNLTFDPDPNKVIPEVLNGLKGILKSAAVEPSVKRFVYTSSSTAATSPIPNKEFTIDANTWNEDAIKKAWAPPPYMDDRKLAVYGASKTEAEKALWEFVKEQKPGFVANAVLPDVNMGIILHPNHGTSTATWVTSLYKNSSEAVENFKRIAPQYHVDVQDTARLHVAALTNPDVKNERLFAFSEPFNWNDILRELRKQKPDRKFPENFVDDNIRNLSKVDTRREAELLKEFRRPGFTSLSESIANNIRGL